MVGVLVLAAVFGVLERFFPATRAKRDKGSVRTDVLWFFAGQLTNVLAQVAFLATLVLFALALGWRRMPLEQWFALRTTLFHHLPRGFQIVFALVVIDFYTYWIHRVQHLPALWRFHAIHHSSTRLDWFAAIRNHPVTELFARAAIVPPLLAFGVDPKVLAGVIPFFGLYGLLLHANVRWGFGPLRHVIATPLSHRWHHASDLAARDKNFGAFLAIWDQMFGTWYCPPHQPQGFGAEGVPAGFFAQLAHPFRYHRRSWPSPSASSPISTSGPRPITTASYASSRITPPTSRAASSGR
jgi:sterol desaturase/sphingolipid hydroxylase (fatty acid hydroxylase superfamily)